MSALRAGDAARRARKPASVSPARWVAWRTIGRTFEDNAFTDRVLTAEAERAQLDPRDRAHAQYLAFGTVQHAKLVDHVIGVVGKRPLRKIDAPVLQALRLGMFELLVADATPDHAAVDQAVEIVRGALGERAVAFTNAVLRRGQVDGADIIARLDRADDDDMATVLSLPEWMVRRMRAAFGQDGADALAAQNATRATTSLRVNTLRATAAEADAQLVALGLVPTAPDGAFAGALPEARIIHGATAALSPAIDAGVFLPQSLSSMLVAHVVDPQPGERVLDMCAAPGGKTTHLAERMHNEGVLVACELHDHRAQSVRDLAERTGATMIEVQVGDATQLDPGDQDPFDRVLVDAPCSGLGVLDRRPDARWQRAETDVDQLVALQLQLLTRAAELTRPGGIVVYSTCTLLPDENEHVVQAVIDSGLLEPDPIGELAPEWLQLPDAPHQLRVWPHVHRSDGFFVARLRRKAASS